MQTTFGGANFPLCFPYRPLQWFALGLIHWQTKGPHRGKVLKYIAQRYFPYNSIFPTIVGKRKTPKETLSNIVDT